jgi:translocator protein
MRKTRREPRSTPLNDAILLVASILVCQAAGGLGAIATMPSIPTWYASLEKPPINPPNWLFGPVWTTLYLLMGLALFQVARRGFRRHAGALRVFALQLALNTAWSVVFFGMHQPGAAFVVILALLASIIWTMARFHRVRPMAAWLLLPYVAWVSFASVLNFFLWQLNP